MSYPEGSHQIIATIYDKDIPSNFKTGALDFVNPFVVMPGILPNINLDFQNPTYFTNRDDILSDVFYCDQKKDICKVNLQLLDNALGKISSNYACMLELSFTGAIIEECNPSKWEIPKGEHTVRIQVYEAENRMNFHERIIQIINTEMDDIEEISTSSG
ncbi:MAG: hypothetical protein H6767_04790 [Candidatus Peribacteria bacterium]|nr:MAG: hypothetical protein H6767_04790 [Candidatus Peribacteria bacterium]